MQPGRAAQLFLLLMTLPLLWQCIKTPLEPVAPKYYTQLAIPLVEKTYYFSDIIRKDSKFDTTTGQILYNPVTDAIGDRIGIPASVFVMDTSQLRGNTINSELGVVPVAIPNIAPASVKAGTLLPAGVVGVKLPALPSQTITIDQSLDASPDGAFKYVVFENGTMALTFENTLPVAITLQGNQVILINDTVTNTPVATFTFSGPIPANNGRLTSSAFPLANITMYKKLRAKATITTDQYNTNPFNPFADSIKVDSTSGVKLTPSFPAAPAIQSAFARLSTDFSNFPVTTIPDSAVKLSDSIRVKTADFRSGNIRIQLQNAAPLAVVVRFRIDELIDKRNNRNTPYKLGDDIGQPGDSLVTIDAKTSFDINLPMSAVRFVSRSRDLLTSDTLPTRFLHFSLQIKTLVRNTSYQTIKKTDYVYANVQPTSQFVLESVYGQIPPKPLAVDQSFDVGIGDIGNRMTLKGVVSLATLQVGVLSTGLFPTESDLWVVPLDVANHRGDSVHIVKTIQPGVKGFIDIPSSDVNKLLNAFLSGPNPLLPSKMLVRGTTTVSPWAVYNSPTGIGSVKQGDSVFVNLKYVIPVAIGINDASMQDISLITQNNTDTTQINRVKEGQIFFTVDNTFPMNLALTIKLWRTRPDSLPGRPAFMDSTSNLLFKMPQDLTDPIHYPPISIAADTTVAHTGCRSFTFITLKSQEATLINQAGASGIELKMKTGGDNGATAKVFRSTDYVRIKTYANITFDVDFDKLK